MSWWWLPKKKNNFPPKTLTYLKDSWVTLEDNTDLFSKFSVVAQVRLWQQNHASCSLAIYGQLLWLPLSVLAAVLSSLPSSCDWRHWEMLWGRINRDGRGYRSKGDEEGPGILLTHQNCLPAPCGRGNHQWHGHSHANYLPQKILSSALAQLTLPWGRQLPTLPEWIVIIWLASHKSHL